MQPVAQVEQPAPTRAAITPCTAGAMLRRSPFPTIRIPQILPPPTAARIRDWLAGSAPWTLRQESFYEQHEICIKPGDLPDDLAGLAEAPFLDGLKRIFQRGMGANGGLELALITAHRLLPGQKIGIHNDYLPEHLTHRALIQLNAGWREDMGGALRLYDGPHEEDLVETILPTHGGGFLFEVSKMSFHAVTEVREGDRLTLVYSFKQPAFWRDHMHLV